jgi:hypothetical protein
VPLFRRGLEAAAVDPAVASAGVRAMEANIAFVCDVRGRWGACGVGAAREQWRGLADVTKNQRC